VINDGRHCYLLFNEEKAPLEIRIEVTDTGKYVRYNPSTTERQEIEPNELLRLRGYELVVLAVEGKG
jgi:hypothetical protein